MYKNQLQELAQRSCFNLPSYSCIREGPDHAPRFKATVNFNGEIFESPTFCSTLRQAEHAAAEVALSTLSKRGPSRSLAARVLDETGVYKNLLQETAHRAGLNLPVYTTVRSGPGHMPVFSCTVELAGMSFTGDLARTKKQAQKNAAMAAWSALKQLPHANSSSSPSSSSPSLGSESSEEQEQVTIARVLASLRPPDGNRQPSQHDSQRGRRKPMSSPRDKNPSVPVSLYPLHYQRWTYAGFAPEVARFQLWQQQQQTRYLALPPPVPNPGVLPFVRSVFPSNDAQFFPSIEQEAGPCAPPSPFYSATSPIPVHTRNRSQVTIQELPDESQMEDQQWLPRGSSEKETGSSGQNTDLSSRSQSFHPFTAQGSHVPNDSRIEPKALETEDDARKDSGSEMGSGDASLKSTLGSGLPTIHNNCFSSTLHTLSKKQEIQKEHIQKERFDLAHGSQADSSVPQDTERLCRGSAGFRPRNPSPRHFPAHSPNSYEPILSSVRHCQPEQLGSSAGLRGFRRPHAVAPPVTIRPIIPVCSAKPRTEGVGNQVSSVNFAAPPVQIGSVRPVSVASPVKEPTKLNDEQLLPPGDKKAAEQDSISAVHSELGKLQI
ncbi:double-stranded RNA-binding protein 2-like [Nymphaea colorata]|nr:double-stranded RNA-binding protein 2-like [Nymphaea colorata]